MDAGRSHQLQDSPAAVTEAYYGAWQRRDPEAIRGLLDDDVVFTGALGATQGLEQTLDGLTRMFAITKEVNIVHRWNDGPDVLTWFELSTLDAGPIPIVNWSHVKNGKIDRIRVTFDPRPLLG